MNEMWGKMAIRVGARHATGLGVAPGNEHVTADSARSDLSLHCRMGEEALGVTCPKEANGRSHYIGTNLTDRAGGVVWRPIGL